jgi:hypothetical protein
MQRPLLTMALAGAHGRLDAARPMIGTAIAVRLLICAQQDRPTAERAREDFAPQKGLPELAIPVLMQCMAADIDKVANFLCSMCYGSGRGMNYERCISLGHGLAPPEFCHARSVQTRPDISERSTSLQSREALGKGLADLSV